MMPLFFICHAMLTRTKIMSTKFLTRLIKVEHFLLFVCIAFVGANGPSLNREDLNTLLHRLHSFPGHLKWNFFIPDYQYARQIPMARKQKSIGSKAETNESNLKRSKNRGIDLGTTFISDTAELDSSGSAEVLIDGQIEVSSNLLAAILQLLSEKKQNEQQDSLTQGSVKFNFNDVDLNHDSFDLHQQKLNLNGNSNYVTKMKPLDFKNDNIKRNKITTSEVSSGGQFKITTDTLIMEIEKLLELSKRKIKDSTNQKIPSAQVQDRIYVSRSNKHKRFKPVEPIILKFVDTGNSLHSARADRNKPNRPNRSKFLSDRNVNRTSNYSQHRSHNFTKELKQNPLKDDRAGFSAGNQAQLEASVDGEVIIQGQIEVPTMFLSNINTLDSKSVQNNNVNLHNKNLHSVTDKSVRSNRQIKPDIINQAQRKYSKQMYFNSTDIIDIGVEGQAEIPKYASGVPEKADRPQINDFQAQKSAIQTKQLKGEAEIQLDTIGSRAHILEGPSGIQLKAASLLAPSLRTIYSAPGLIKHKTLSSRQKIEKSNSKSTGRAYRTPERLDDAAMQLLPYVNSGLFIAPGFLRKRHSRTMASHVNRTKSATLLNSENVAYQTDKQSMQTETHMDASGTGQVMIEGQIEVPSMLLGFSNFQQKRRMIDHKKTPFQSHMNNINRNKSEYGSSDKFISQQIALDASDRGAMTVEGQIKVPSYTLTTFGAGSNSFGGGTKLHNKQNNLDAQKKYLESKTNQNSQVQKLDYLKYLKHWNRMQDPPVNSMTQTDNTATDYSGRKRVYSQSQNSTSSEAQLKATGRGDLMIEVQAELPTNLLDEIKTGHNAFMRKVGKSIPWENSNERKQKSERSNVQSSIHASTSGEFIVEGQIEIPNKFSKPLKTTKNVNKDQKKRFQHLQVSELVQCYVDPNTKQLSCDLNKIHQRCKEKWDFPNPCLYESNTSVTRRYKHPRDNTKFLSCTEKGKFYIVQCPQHEVFHEHCGRCSKERFIHSYACLDLKSSESIQGSLHNII